MGRLLAILVVLSLFLGNSHAALYDRGGGLIYDSDLNITWLQDANYAQTTPYSGADTDGRMTWAVANAWASNLSYYDSVRGVTYTDWRLPSTINNDESAGYSMPNSSEMAYMFYTNLNYPAAPWDDRSDDQMPPNPPVSNWFPNLKFWSYWSGTEYGDTGLYAWSFHYHFGFNGYDGKTAPLNAWAVRDGDVAAVPIPPAAWLLGSGCLGILALKRKRQV